MSQETQRYELTVSLSINSTSTELLDAHVTSLEEALVNVISEVPAITAYFVTGDYEAFEVNVGLRFERMKAEYVEDVANDVIDAAIAAASNANTSGPRVVREESTLVPA
jgi:hypothetical protein